MVPSKSQVNKAGQIIRDVGRRRLDLQDPRLDWAFDVLVAYRAAHQYPLVKASNGLRSILRTEQIPGQVSQRLKRIPTIGEKLQREPSMQLARMQDIGGCRAVLASLDELRAVERRLRKNRPPARVSDYIRAPRTSGYRALHLVVMYEDRDQIERAVEVQLRTQVMHDWAFSIEQVGGRIGDELKSGIGPAPVLDFLRAVAEAMAAEEGGEMIPRRLRAELAELRSKALPFLGTEPRRES